MLMVFSFFAITQLFFAIKTLMYFSFILTTTVLSLSFFLPYFCHFSVFSASFLSAQRLFPLLRFTSLFVTLFTFCFTSLVLLRSLFVAHSFYTTSIPSKCAYCYYFCASYCWIYLCFRVPHGMTH